MIAPGIDWAGFAQTVLLIGLTPGPAIGWPVTLTLPEACHALAGLVINLVNPTSALFFITVMAQFIASGRPDFAPGPVRAAISVGIATALHGALALAMPALAGRFLAKAFVWRPAPPAPISRPARIARSPTAPPRPRRSIRASMRAR